jgi:succinate dehydrogenase/fumarate reductase flavoprotein subunit
METTKIGKRALNIHRYNTIIVGAGAAGMNCAVHLYEFMEQKGIERPQDRIAVVTAGLPLGASRMSGSDKQTYYKMGTSPDVADSAQEFARSLTAAGCCHGDLALAEAIGSLREFYHLVQAGVPFPHDPMGSYIGYKTDHDPYERATSAGPKTSKFMSECLQKQVKRYGIRIFDHQEMAELVTAGTGSDKRIAAVAAVDRKSIKDGSYALNLFMAGNFVLAAGGPGEMYETTVYPRGQVGIHGLAFRAGLAAENLTESQFGLASIKFRWNVSGTYMQVVPRIFSTDANGNDPREFLTPFFSSMSKMATDIFLKGYQWPFDPQRIAGHQSSLVDVLVFSETQKGRRVFMDFLKNPIGSPAMKKFDLYDLEPEALGYLKATGALQATPIERLFHMNPPAIDIYTENNIDLYKEPLEIAVCAQHNNGGIAIDRWWQTSIPRTFCIGEMAGSHGVKRPGGSALNAGQAGGLRAAEYIVNTCGGEVVGKKAFSNIKASLAQLVKRLDSYAAAKGDYTPAVVISEIRSRMTRSGGHIREMVDASRALCEAVTLYNGLSSRGFKLKSGKDLPLAIQAEHMALASVGYLKAVVELLRQGSGSRGSHLVLSPDGVEVHKDVIDKVTRKPLRYKPENQELRKSILRVEFDAAATDLFSTKVVPVRTEPKDRKAFEPAWKDFREGNLFASK